VIEWGFNGWNDYTTQALPGNLSDILISLLKKKKGRVLKGQGTSIRAALFSAGGRLQQATLKLDEVGHLVRGDAETEHLSRSRTFEDGQA
jgi:hypothetical protein